MPRRRFFATLSYAISSPCHAIIDAMLCLHAAMATLDAMLRLLI